MVQVTQQCQQVTGRSLSEISIWGDRPIGDTLIEGTVCPSNGGDKAPKPAIFNAKNSVK